MFISQNLYLILFLALLVRGITDLFFPSIPFFWRIGKKLTERLAGKLDRERRSMATRSIRGALFLIFLIICAAGLGMSIDLLRGFSSVVGDVVAFGFFYLSIGFVFAAKRHSRIWHLLENTKDNRDEILNILQSLDIPVSRVTRDKDVFARLGIVSVGYAINRFLVGPVVWFLLLGFFGMFFYIFVMSAAIALPRKEDFDFGWSSRMTARLLDILPGIVTGLLLFLSSWSSFGARPIAVFKTVCSGFKETATYGLLFIQSVLAGAIGCVLGGLPRHWYVDRTVHDLWLGQETDSAKGNRMQLRSAIRLSVVVYALVLVVIMAFCIKTIPISSIFVI